MEITATVSGLSLQGYSALHEALCTGNQVRNISVFEEAYFKSKDLQLVLSLVGLTADGSRKKRVSEGRTFELLENWNKHWNPVASFWV
eukprot:1157441-Pelagomonas_calceolata.AAC.7